MPRSQHGLLWPVWSPLSQCSFPQPRNWFTSDGQGQLGAVPCPWVTLSQISVLYPYSAQASHVQISIALVPNHYVHDKQSKESEASSHWNRGNVCHVAHHLPTADGGFKSTVPQVPPIQCWFHNHFWLTSGRDSAWRVFLSTANTSESWVSLSSETANIGQVVVLRGAFKNSISHVGAVRSQHWVILHWVMSACCSTLVI